MSATFTVIKVSSREKAGKGAARAARRQGLVPAVVYGGKQAPTLIALDPRLVMRELSRPGWRSRLFDIQGENGSLGRGLMRDIQLHPVGDYPLHVDFQRLAVGQHIRVEIQIIIEGEEKAPGIKRGGVVNIVRHTVEVNCDAEHIPESFRVDISGLDIHDTIRWSDLAGTENVTPVMHDVDFVIVTIAAPTVEVEASEDAAGEGSAGGDEKKEASSEG
ncbi:50S ribosomal protein L25/general stress protein Ctc [Entomobacter blattae]|uniref:Large ribosomal subunit protein bL25 n=1 Tax=Entomobacter blattae TaxID=2762277 RepID=A0A7H1NQ94_9PROT|nr:50S ribosomal protein L25/general stress protein Ctc [Entomobacter blattae]QNT77954.1 50S ribosomal protein L25 [Entomobacter blattae]